MREELRGVERGETVGGHIVYERTIYFQKNEEIRGCNPGSLVLKFINYKIEYIKDQDHILMFVREWTNKMSQWK